MNIAARNGRIAILFNDALKLLEAKAKDYSPSGSAFENFEKIAAMDGGTKEDVLWTLLSKQLVTIRSGVSTTEPMRVRTMDAINYLAILQAMRDAEDPRDPGPFL